MDDKTPRNPVTVQISDYEIACLLVSAREGGSNYWARFLKCPYTFYTDDLMPFRFPAEVLEIGEGTPNKRHTLDREALNRGLALLPKYPRHLADILQENTDAETGDVFLQLCLLGDIVYG